MSFIEKIEKNHNILYFIGILLTDIAIYCCSINHVQLFVTLWTVQHQAFLSFCISHFAQIHVHGVNDAIQLSHPLSHPSPPALNLYQYKVLMQLSLCIRWPKYWSFSFSIDPSNDFSRLVSLGLTDLISLLSKGLSRAFSSTTI